MTVNSDTQITATAPAGTVSTNPDITVSTSVGISATSSADKFTYTTSGVYFVQMGGNSTTVSGASPKLTVPTGVTHAVGNLLAIAVGGALSSGSAVVPTGATDSRGNTYVVAVTNAVGSTASAILFSKLTTALQPGDQITITMASAADTTIILDSVEFNITGLTAATDQTSVGNSTTAVTALDAGTTSATTQAQELAFSAYCIGGSTGGSAAGAGFTKLNDLTASGGLTRALVWEYQVLNATATVHSTATITTGHSHVACAATIK